MLENYVSEVSYVIAVLIFTLAGDRINEKGIIPSIKGWMAQSEFKKVGGALLGTGLYILSAVLGVIVVKYLLIRFNIINTSNVDIVAVIVFIGLAIYLEEKYRISGSA